MKWRRFVPHILLWIGGLGVIGWSFVNRPFPPLGANPVLDLVHYYTPNFHAAILTWYYVSPFVVVMLSGLFLMSGWKVWLEGRRRDFSPFETLPPWPLDPKQKSPAIVIGEVHHPVVAREIFNPSWLTIPERGLYTGVAIFGAVGSGKTSACMHPFAKQLLGWQAGNPQKRAAALVLEVKGDFCHDIHRILTGAGRGNDYIELSMEGPWQWNPLSAWWLDSYSLAYTVSSLLNQLFGKGKEPFWQQAYTNLVRWIIELYRALPERWVTLQMVYQCAIDPQLFAKKIAEAQAFSDELNTGIVHVSSDDVGAHKMVLAEWQWSRGERPGEQQAPYSRPLTDKLDELNLTYRTVWLPGRGDDVRERVAAVRRWFEHDWRTLDNKIKSSIVEGVSVFLAMFDLPDVAKVFCPPVPAFSYDPKAISFQAGERMRAEREGRETAQSQEPQPAAHDETPDFWPGVSPATDGEDPDPEAQADPKKKKPIPAKEGADRVAGPRHLPPIHQLIDEGKVLALNMPAGTNPALARAIGVMLKNAWLQSLLMRPAKMKQSPGVYFRPAVFICDEYQAFASVGEDDPSGDEKSFALTRQCRCIPIVATQSISSLRSVLGSSEAWRSLLQTLRTRIFLSLSDDASARIASELCGQVAKIKDSYTISETSQRSGVSPLSGRAGGGSGSIGATKSFREQREAVFHPRDFALLGNCQAICLPYDGAQSLEPRRVYLKPYYLPDEHSYWRARDAGQI